MGQGFQHPECSPARLSKEKWPHDLVLGVASSFNISWAEKRTLNSLLLRPRCLFFLVNLWVLYRKNVLVVLRSTMTCKLSFSEQRLSSATKHWKLLPRNTSLPLVTWRDPITSQWQLPALLLTRGQGYACVFPQDATVPIWVPSSNVGLAIERGQWRSQKTRMWRCKVHIVLINFPSAWEGWQALGFGAPDSHSFACGS